MVEYLDTRTEPKLPRAIIGLGENIKIGYNAEKIRNSNFYQSIYSKEVAIALAYEYQKSGASDKPMLIFSGGHTSGKDVPSEAEAMASYAKHFAKKYFGIEIPNKHIILEKNSIDTSTQAEVLKEMTDNRYDVDSVVAASFHNRRVKGIFEYFKFSSNFIDAESGVAEISEKHKKLMKKQTSKLNFRMWPDRIMEIGLNTARYILLDPGQKKLRFLTERSRSSQEAYSRNNLKLQPITA